MDKIRLATVWLTGCSGCHMSFLDLDEWLIELAQKVDVVYSPVGSDIKEYPDNVDVVLVEGAVGTEDNLKLIQQVRDRTKFLISFGDCAVTSNVPGMRNLVGSKEQVLQHCYEELGSTQPQIPQAVPKLLNRVRPVHEVVSVDLFVPGCPPEADRIRATLEPLLNGEMPEMVGRDLLKFG